MPNTILKRWNGSAFEELYPKTIVGQISASGTLSSSTFLRGDGQWQIPATQSHTHGNITNAGAIGSTSGLVVVTTTSGVLTTSTPADSQSASPLGTSASIATERDIYYGTPTINNSKAYTSSTSIYAPTSAGTAYQFLVSNGGTTTPSWASPFNTTTIASLAQNTLSSTYTVTGYRFATVQLSQTAANTTTTVATIRIDLTDTNQRGTTTGNQRYHRFVWNNGTSTFADNLEIYSASSTSIQFRHNAGVTFRYRITWELGL
jgi:hypothetical protein